MLIRPAQASDCPALATLDSQCNPSPWHSQQFLNAHHQSHTHLAIAETDGLLLGFAVWQTVCGQSELHLIAVTPEQRRQGIATRLLQHWQQHTATVERRFLEVRADNLAAQLLYSRHGFQPSGRRKNYYPNPDGSREDAVLMEQIC